MSKILIVLPGMYYGGMERVAFITREILIKKGHKVELVTLFKGDPDYTPDFDYTSLNCEIKNSKIGKIINTFQRMYCMRKFKNTYDPDIVLTYGKSPAFVNVFTKKKEQVFVGIRSYDWLERFYYGYTLEKLMYRKADKVISVSKLIQMDAEKKFAIPKEKSTFLYNPYDLEVIQKKAAETIVETEIPNDKKIVVTAGRLENQKGFYHLVKAVALLPQSKKNEIHVYIMGHGSKFNELQKLIKQLNVESQISLLGGQSNPYKFMSRADLYIMPSISEGFPNALVEAMAVGTPVLSADCKSGPREILTNETLEKRTKGIEYGEYGVLFEEVTDSRIYTADTIEECDRIMATAISSVLWNQKLLDEYGCKALERVKAFSYETYTNNLLRIIDQ